MTPLNSILNNSKIIHEDFESGEVDLEEIAELIKEIMHSAKILHFFNSNQIEKMKVE